MSPAASRLLIAAVFLLGGTVAAGAGAEDPPAAGPAYVGSETCLTCHEKTSFFGTAHGAVSRSPRTEAEGRTCEACHGPGGVHVENPSKESIRTFDPDQKEEPRDWNAACLSCHERGGQARWRGSSHDSHGVACVACHTMMHEVSDTALLAKPGRPSETCLGCHLLRRSMTMRSSHMPMREGKLECTSCHDPHGGLGPALLPTVTVNETCYRCHAEKRGPFLWEHPPAREGCTNCHEPHGSLYEQLLVRDTPRLCMQCHGLPGHPSRPGPAEGRDSRYVFNRACVNCHPAVHGSNHPSGHLYQR
jgi:DmsE family decaheme c-type cytochrome